MTANQNDIEQRCFGGWPAAFWVVVVPGLYLLLLAGTKHLAGRLEGALRQMSIQADMVVGPLPGILVFATLLMLFVFREPQQKRVALRMLIGAILLAATLLITDFLAAVAIQLAWPPTPTNDSEGWRVVLQAAVLVPYFLWMYTEYRKLRAAAEAEQRGAESPMTRSNGDAE